MAIVRAFKWIALLVVYAGNTMIVIFIIISVSAVSVGIIQTFSSEYRRYKATLQRAEYISIKEDEKRLQTQHKRAQAIQLARLKYAQLINRWYQLDQRVLDLHKIGKVTKMTDTKNIINPETYELETVTDVKAIKQRLVLERQFESIQKERLTIINQLYKIYDLLSYEQKTMIDSIYNDYLSELN